MEGKSTTRRSFPNGAPILTRDDALQAKGQWEAKLERDEVTVGRMRFSALWESYLPHARANMTPGSFVELRSHGPKRLLPFFGEMQVSKINVAAVRQWRAEMFEAVEAGEFSPYTANNARIALKGCLKVAVEDKLLSHNPVRDVKPLQINRLERPYLRIGQIMGYIEAAPIFYRPLAEFLIGTGARISEAIAVQLIDVDFHTLDVKIHKQRASGDTLAMVPTKGKRFRTVSIGPELAASLQDMIAMRAELGIDDGGWLFLCPPPTRGRYSKRKGPTPPHRKTVHDWHEKTLADAGIPDMPLHSLRHTAAAAWLGTGRSLEFVRAQLGHSSVKVTSDYYGHIEEHFRAEGAADTEARIREARRTRVIAVPA